MLAAWSWPTNIAIYLKEFICVAFQGTKYDCLVNSDEDVIKHNIYSDLDLYSETRNTFFCSISQYHVAMSIYG